MLKRNIADSSQPLKMTSFSNLVGYKKLFVTKLSFDGIRFTEIQDSILFDDVKSIERQVFYPEHFLVTLKGGEEIIISENFTIGGTEDASCCS